MPPDQTTFRTALLDAANPVPDGLTDPEGAGAGKRFSVYRNNVAMSLTEALQASFPILEKLIGPGNFASLAGLYLRAHPPRTPLMMHYGADMPAFLEGFEPLRHIGYLPDIARLELAMRRSYHAADSTPVPPDALADLTEASRLRFAPALILLPSPWPLWDIWRFNTQDDAPKPHEIAQPVLITRPAFDPEPHALSPAEAAWIHALQAGETLGAALTAGAEKDPDFDMTQALTLLLQGNAITQITA